MEFSQSMKQTITNFVNSIGNTINTKISLHNNSSNAHQDIRNSIPDVGGKSDIDHIHGNLNNNGTITTTHSNTFTAFAGIGSTGILYKASKMNASVVRDTVAHNNMGSSANETQKLINQKIDTALGEKVNTTDLSAVATTGSFNDLTNKPATVEIVVEYCDGTSETIHLLRSD